MKSGTAVPENVPVQKKAKSRKKGTVPLIFSDLSGTAPAVAEGSGGGEKPGSDQLEVIIGGITGLAGYRIHNPAPDLAPRDDFQLDRKSVV